MTSPAESSPAESGPAEASRAEGGAGDALPRRIDEQKPFLPVRVAVLTVSDTRTPETDRSGDVLAERVAGAGHVLADRRIVRDERAEIEAALSAWIADPEIDVAISTGGTGLTGRDVTVEAHRALYQKEVDGFSTLFHMISARKIGTSTMQSRACAGVADGTYLFALPGSPGACKDAWDDILRWQFDLRHRPCNMVEIMPRLMEGGIGRSRG
ncbi:MAG: molybdenum cofactor biosynthesis protein B [Pseudomonadota bacterium]